MKINIKLVSLLVFITPILTVFISFFLSVHFNLVEFCFPNLDGCTSISRVGRYPPVNFFFKPFMFLSGIFIFMYWKYNYLLILKKNNIFLVNLIFFLGICSVIFFFLYIFFLGEGVHYRFFRKIGIFIYIFFTVLAELLLSILFYKKRFIYLNLNFVNLKFFFNIFLASFGIILFPIVTNNIIDYPNIKNIISWNFFLLIQINYLITYFCWNFNKKN